MEENKIVFRMAQSLNDINDADNLKRVINEYYIVSEKLLEADELDRLQNNMFTLKSKISRYTIKEEQGNNSIYFLGKLFGMLEIQDLVLTSHFNRHNKISAITDNDLRMIPHINDIIFNIANFEGIRHGQLAEKTHLEKNNLTAIMKRLDTYNVVVFIKQGKFKCYYLSDFGKQYYDKYLKKQKSVEYVDSLIENLAISIRNQKDSEYILNKFIRVLFEQDNYKSHNKSNKQTDYLVDFSKMFLRTRLSAEENEEEIEMYSDPYSKIIETQYLTVTDNG